MNEAETRRSARPRFSLSHLLTLTALIAIGMAAGLAYRKNRAMVQQRDELLSLSSRLRIDNPYELAVSEMPRVADDFQSWSVHVPARRAYDPTGQEYHLRLGIGAVSEAGIPPIVGRVRIAAGRHRVTLHTGDSPSEEFRYIVYVDGKQVIEKTMGSDWIPSGWSSASSMNWPREPWPREPMPSPDPLQLSARSYKSRLEFGKGRGRYFNGQSDNYVTRKGYRLWIDRSDRTYQPASPFVGFVHDPRHLGIGLRDGLRYKPSSRQPYDWTFTRPDLNTNDPVLRIAAEFVANDGKILSRRTHLLNSWQLRGDAIGEKTLRWQADPAQSMYSAFLQTRLKSGDAPQPVVEMKWEAGRPDEVGLRLADTPANETISQWRLRFLGGSKHLWRELQLGDRTIDAKEVIDNNAASSPDATVTLEIGSNGTEDIELQWQTNETLPLQILERRQKRYAGMKLYNGLPLAVGVQIPAAMNPVLSVKAAQEASNAPGEAFPGGNVFEEIQLDLEAIRHEWVWLQTKPKM